MKQVAAALAADPAARAGFVQSGALKAVQELGKPEAACFDSCSTQLATEAGSVEVLSGEMGGSGGR